MVHTQFITKAPQKMSDKPEYRLYFALIFPFSLLAVLFERLMPRPQLPMSRPKQRRSVFADAIEKSHMVVPFVFMGR
ncbi:MAG: hypothetical protein AAF720_10640 [Pseudomonadota bacterium]